MLTEELQISAHKIIILYALWVCGKSCVNSIKTDLLGENYGRNNFYQGGFST